MEKLRKKFVISFSKNMNFLSFLIECLVDSILLKQLIEFVEVI